MSSNLPTPPAAHIDRRETQLHGHTLVDDYAWLREKSSPEVIAYLTAENDYTAAATAPLKPLEERLYSEMLSHIKETDVSVPYRSGAFFYYARTAEGRQYPTYCRRPVPAPATPDTPDDPSQPEQIILDVNQLGEGKPYMALGGLAISPDGKLLAYTTDDTGFRQYTLHIRDISGSGHLRGVPENSVLPE
ncbi:MAG TPA: oligopeptidase B, partial [Acidobacteriaceae bacterium]